MYSGLWTKNGEQILPSFISINAKVVDLAAQIQFTKTYSGINKYFEQLNKLNNSKEEDATFKAYLNTSMGVLCGFEINLDGKKITSQVVSQQDAMRLFEKNQSDTDIVKEAGEFTNSTNVDQPHIEEDFFLCKVNSLSQYKELEIIITYSTEMTTQGDYLLMEFPTSLTTIRSTHQFDDLTNINNSNTNINNINNSNLNNITPVNSNNINNINTTPNTTPTKSTSNSLSLSSSSIQLNQKQGLLIEMNLEMPSKISEIVSPSHPKGIQVETNGETGKVTYRDSRSIDVVNQSDLVVLIKLDNPHEPYGFIEENDKGSRALMIAFYPQLPTTYSSGSATNTEQSELIFLVDVSESMEGYNIKHAKKALHRFLHSLQKDTLFNIISFASTHRKLFPQSVKYDNDNLTAATQYVESLKAVKQGETNLLEPLKDIYSTTPLKSRKIFLLTDGRVNNNFSQIISLIRENSHNTSIFPIGMEYTSRQLIEYIANAGSGVAELVIENETIESKVMRQLKRALQPAISNIKVDWGSLSSKSQAPRDLRTLFFGDRLIIYNILASDENIDGTTVKLMANGPNGPVSFPVTIKKEEIKKGNLVHSLAAYTLIQDLQDQIYENPEQDLEPIKQKIIDLGIKYGLASNYTSFCSVEEPEQFNDLLKKQKEQQEKEEKEQQEKLKREKEEQDLLKKQQEQQKVSPLANKDGSALLANYTLSDKPNDNGLFNKPQSIADQRLKVQSESAMISLRSSASSVPTTVSGSGIPFYNPSTQTSPSHSTNLNNNTTGTSLKTPSTPLSKSTLKVSSPEFVPGKALNANSTPFYPSPMKTSTNTTPTNATPAKPAATPVVEQPKQTTPLTAAALIAQAQAEQAKQVTTAPVAVAKPTTTEATVKPVVEQTKPVAPAVEQPKPVVAEPVKPSETVKVEQTKPAVEQSKPVVAEPVKPSEPVKVEQIKPVETTPATTPVASTSNTAPVKPNEPAPKLSAAEMIAKAHEQAKIQQTLYLQQQKERLDREAKEREAKEEQARIQKELRQKEKQEKQAANKKQSKQAAKQQQQSEKSSSTSSTAAEPTKPVEATTKPAQQVESSAKHTVNSITSTLQSFGFQTNDNTPVVKQPSTEKSTTSSSTATVNSNLPKPAVTNILPIPISTARRVYNNDFLLSFRESNTKAPDSLKTTPIFSNGPQGISPSNQSKSFGKKRGIHRGAEHQPATPVIVKKIFSQDVQGEHIELLKKFKNNLNKITMDTYSTLVKNIEELKVPDEEALKSISKILFEKAIIDQKYSAVYAILTGHLDNAYPKFGEVSLKRAILENCQNEFAAPGFDKSKFENLSKEDLEEQEFIFKRRVLGNIKFIGELYKHNVLGLKITIKITEQLISKCEEKLDEESIEPLVKLLTTIGKKLDEVDKPNNDAFFAKIQNISDSDSLSSRGRFILLDLLDLRANKWAPKNTNQTKSKKEETEKEERFIAKHGGKHGDNEESSGSSRRERGGRRGGDREDRDGDRRGGRGGKGGDRKDRDRKGDRDRDRDGDNDRKGKSAFGSKGGKDGWETVGGNKGGRGSGKGDKTPKKSDSAFGSSLFGGKSSAAPGNLSGGIQSGSPYRPGQGLAKRGDTNESPSRSNLFSALDSDEDIAPSSSPQQPSYFKGAAASNKPSPFGNAKPVQSGRQQQQQAPVKQEKPAPAPVEPPKPVVPKIDFEKIEDLMSMTLDEYVETLDIDEAIECIKEINEPTVLGKQFNIFIMKSLERKENEKEAIIELFIGCLTAQLFSAENIKDGLQEIIDNIEDIEVDLPFSGQFVSKIVAICIENEIFSLNYLEEAFSHIVDSGKAEEMIVNTFNAIVKISNKDRLVEIYENTEGLDILKLFTLKNRKVSYLEEFYQTHFPYLSHEKAVEGNDNVNEQPEIIEHLLLSQTADGNWQLNKKLAGILGVSLNSITESNSSDSVIVTHPDVWATCLVISYLNLEFIPQQDDDDDDLELVLEKSQNWLSNQFNVDQNPPKESKDEVLLKAKRLLSELL